MMIEKIKEKYLNDRQEITDWDKTEKKSIEKLKNGVYAFYNNEVLLYIGMVSNAKTASL